ncbi:hypothetical protein O7A70_12670 [Mesorhizobium sp. Cs1299R1N1]|uniref:hypothetical protein n=1 Tax=Mesorhizobium sp. Cs1299R1N1 TaxID=3015172 RepID=UPI00301B99B3
MQALLNRNPRALVLTINHEGGQIAPAVLPTSLTASTSPVAVQASRLAAALESIVEHVTMANNRFTPNARADHLREVAVRVAPDLRNLAVAGTAEARAIATANARIYEPAPLTNAPLESEQRQKFASLTTAEQAMRIPNLNHFELSALSRGGRDLSNVRDDNLWNMVQHQLAITGHIERTGLQSDFQRKPDLSDPIAIGPNREAALAAAEKALEAHEARSTIVDDTRTAISSIVSTIAVMTDMTPAAAYDLVMDGKAA